MTKKILSVAAAAAIMTTGVQAFDIDVTTGNAINYKDGSQPKATAGYIVPANPALPSDTIDFSLSQTGNALIYPAYFTKDGWVSKFTVVNTSSTNAIAAKVAMYRGTDSKELRDFNIYLSPNDVFRAEVKMVDGTPTIISTDSSTAVGAVTDNSVTPIKDTITMASESQPFKYTVGFDGDDGAQSGYIVVMAMADMAATPGGAAVYHKKHNLMAQDYYRGLDNCRNNGGVSWRNTGNISYGLYTAALQGALQSGTCPIATSYTSTSGTARSATLSTPPATLRGTMLVENDGSVDGKSTRSLRLNAVAVTNFLDNKGAPTNMMLWAPGEQANIADRCLNGSTYDVATCLVNDAQVLNSAFSFVEFGDVSETKVLLTQIYKRSLVQAGSAAAGGWSGFTRNSTSKQITNYGGFTLGSPNIYNDDED